LNFQYLTSRLEIPDPYKKHLKYRAGHGENPKHHQRHFDFARAAGDEKDEPAQSFGQQPQLGQARVEQAGIRLEKIIRPRTGTF
jgi:hypothetical protein